MVTEEEETEDLEEMTEEVDLPESDDIEEIEAQEEVEESAAVSVEDEDEIDTLHKLPKMAKRARQMLRISIEAFTESDAELAQSMMRRDDKLDKQYRKLYLEALEEMRDDDYIRRATFLMWVGHNLERIGDRATNIAERVIFMTTGHFVENIETLD